MTKEQIDRIESALVSIATDVEGLPEYRISAANALTDIHCRLENMRMYKEDRAADRCKEPVEFPKVVVDKEREDFEYELYHQPADEEKCSWEDVPAPGGCVVSQYCNNELIHKLIKELNTGELVNTLAKESVIVQALQNSTIYAYTCLAKDPTLLEAAIVGDHYIALICGGNNGDSTWTVYFNQLTSIIYSLREKGYSAWLIRLDNDCPDDVWYAYIGLSACEDI